MKSRITEVPEGVVVEIEELHDQRAQLLETFTACREGRCSCPTDEYDKLESLDIEDGESGLKLHLHAKPGATFEVSEIERCLEYNGIDSEDDAT